MHTTHPLRDDISQSHTAKLNAKSQRTMGIRDKFHDTCIKVGEFLRESRGDYKSMRSCVSRVHPLVQITHFCFMHHEHMRRLNPKSILWIPLDWQTCNERNISVVIYIYLSRPTWQLFPPKSKFAHRGSEKSLGHAGVSVSLKAALQMVIAFFDNNVFLNIWLVRDNTTRSRGSTHLKICEYDLFV